MRELFLCAAASLVLAASLGAQTSATLRGRVVDPTGAAVAGASATLRNPISGYEQRAFSGADGSFAVANIPFQDYTLAIESPGFAPYSRTVSLRSNLPVEIEVMLAVSEVSESLSVTAFERASLVDSEGTGTRTQLDMAQIEHMPVPAGARALESVLLSFPGFAANANGAIHPRGAHNQMTYVIDGMPIGDQLTGAFGNSIESGIVQTIELFTGNIPAEHGGKVSGVANITTRSGLNAARPFFGSLETTGAQFDHLGTVVQAGGQKGRFGWFTSAAAQKSNRFLDQVSRDNLHNGGNAERGFARFDYQVGPADFLRVNLIAGRSSFQLANLRSQHAAGQSQRQRIGDAAVSVGYIHVIGSTATFESISSYRTAVAQLYPSAGDTPVTAAQARHNSALTLANRMNAIQGRHEFRFGFDYQHFPVSENFSFAITDPEFNRPDSEEFIETLLDFDLSRAGRLFHFSDRASGNFYSGYFQDKIKAGPLVLNLGLRFDRYAFLVSGSQVQPRLGVAYTLPGAGTVLRASYNRLYQTPVNENLLLSNSERAAVLAPPDVRATLNGGLIRIRPQTDDVYEVGAQQSLGGRWSLNAMYFRKRVRNMHDNDNFFNTGIIFPTSLESASVRGAEARIVFPEHRGFNGSLSMTHFHTVVTPPFTGGLFLGSAAIEALSAGPFIIDHDQKLAMHGVASYRPRRNIWTSASVRFDSGLVSNPSDPVEVAADPDYADLLPYVNLGSDPPRVRPRTLVDVMAGYEGYAGDRRRWEAVLQVSNLTNRTALYNFQSIFVGTRLVQPRTLGVRLRWYW